jgi:hypothetical protein
LVTILSAASELHAAQINVDSSKPASSTYVQGERIEIHFHISAANQGIVSAVTYKIIDESGNTVVAERQQKISVDNTGSADFTAIVPSDRTGYYSVVATLSDGTSIPALGTRPAGVFSYAVVMDPASRQDYGDQLSRFGLQGGFNRDVNVIPLLGVRYVFQQAAEWGSAEQNSPGQFRKSIDTARAAGSASLRNKSDLEKLNFNGQKWQTYVIAMLTQGKLPKWALDAASAGKSGGGVNFSAIAADKRQDFTAFAAAHAEEVAFDYPNQTSHIYQVTWEPMFPDGYGGTSAQLVDIYKLSYDAIHRNDGRAMVAGPTLVLYKASEQQLRDLLKAGFADYIDVFSLHAYEESDKWPLEISGFKEDLLRQVSLVREAAHKQVPFISTEHGFQSEKYGILNQALANIRSTVILLGEGAQIVINFYVADFWNKSPQTGGQSWGFYWNLNPALEYGTNKVGPKPVVPAYAAMTYILDGSQSQGPIQGLSGSQMGYQFARGDTQILVLWDYMSASNVALIAGNDSPKICDWMGNCAAAPLRTSSTLKLSAKPTYVIGKNLSIKGG